MINSGNFIVKNGNVGIGTVSPINKLEIVGTTNTTDLIIDNKKSCTGKLITDVSGNVVCGTDNVNDGDYVIGNEYPLAGSGITVSGREVSVTSGVGVPSGAVMAFNLASCPAGWIASNGGSGSGTVDLRNRFIRGLGSGRSLGSYQADSLKNHTHSLSPNRLSAHTGSWNDNGGNINAVNRYGLIQTVSIGYTGGSETRPVNIAFLYCQKQ